MADKSLSETLTEMLRSAVRLKVITAVGTPRISGSADSPSDVMPDPAISAVSVMNLIEGDIVTVYPAEMITGDLKPAMQLHQDNVAKAETIVRGNIQLVRDLIQQGFTKIADGKPVPPAP